MEIWIRKDGENDGPYTLDQVKKFVAIGEVTLEDEAWMDGCDDYVTVGDIPHFTSPRKVALEEHGKNKPPPILPWLLLCVLIVTVSVIVIRIILEVLHDFASGLGSF